MNNNIDTDFYRITTDYLKGYQWHLLWKYIDRTSFKHHKQTIAIRAFLLVAWWKDYSLSKSILITFPLKISDHLTYFTVTLAWISIADTSKINSYLNNIPKDIPKWMINWIDIELLGRSLKFKQQIQFVKKISKKKEPSNWILVALLQSLKNTNEDISYLKKYLNNINLSSSNKSINIAICLRASIKDLSQISTADLKSEIVLYEYSRLLLSENKFSESLIAYDRLVQTNFIGLNDIIDWLELAISIPQGKGSFIQRLDYILKNVPDSLAIKGTIVSFWLLFLWIEGDYKNAESIISKFHKYILLEEAKNIKNMQKFFRYLIQLFLIEQSNSNCYLNSKSIINTYTDLIVIGDSHSLSLANLHFKLNNNDYCAKSILIFGIKMYHLGQNKENFFTKCLMENINKLPNGSKLFFCIGEIDTRYNEGIWKVVKEKGLDLDNVIQNTVEGYINFLFENLSKKRFTSITIQGIPAPSFKSPNKNIKFLNMIKSVNNKLKKLTINKGWIFFDIYSATSDEEGKCNNIWKIDDTHISPLLYLKADKWLIHS